MRSLTISAPHSIAIVDRSDIPDPGPNEIVIQVAACGVCGTDLHIYEGAYLGTYPVVPGHEFAGTVIATGTAITRFRSGDRVAVEPNLPCNNCPQCLSNRQNFCERWQAIGVTLPGAMAEYVVVPESAAFAVGDLPFERAAFVEPLSCVLHGVGKLTIEPGASVALLGAGPIGMLLARTLAARGATRISVVERNANRRAFAAAALAGEALTVRAVVSTHELAPDSFDLVVDATGVPAVMAAALGLVRAGGEVLWFGVPARDATIDFAPFEIFRKGVSIHGSYTSVRNTLQAIEFLQSGAVVVDDLVTHRVSLEDVEATFRDLFSGASQAMKVIVIPRG